MLTLARTNNRDIQEIDVNNAFLNGLLLEEVFMVPPLGFEAREKNLLCKLHKSLYELKHAHRLGMKGSLMLSFNLDFPRVDVIPLS